MSRARPRWDTRPTPTINKGFTDLEKYFKRDGNGELLNGGPQTLLNKYNSLRSSQEYRYPRPMFIGEGEDDSFILGTDYEDGKIQQGLPVIGISRFAAKHFVEKPDDVFIGEINYPHQAPFSPSRGISPTNLEYVMNKMWEMATS